MKLRIKDANLSWKVLNYDFNTKKVYNMECLGHDMVEEIAKRIKYKGNKPDEWNSIKNEKELREYVRRELMYHYWSKAEMEISVGDLFCKSSEDMEKIDAWRQLEMNFDHIIEHIKSEMHIDFKDKSEDETDEEV